VIRSIWMPRRSHQTASLLNPFLRTLIPSEAPECTSTRDARAAGIREASIVAMISTNADAISGSASGMRTSVM
jgi:hypothetical protein